MSTKNESKSLAFIISTDRQKADPETRKIIRSHVMRGKNRAKPRRNPQRSLQGNKPEMGFLLADDPIWLSSISRLLSSKFSAICFADAVDPALVEDVLSFSSILSNAMFLLNQCITPTTTGAAQSWFEPMLFDAAYLNAACFTTQVYFDGLLTRTRSAETQRRDCIYYAKAIRLLQERLALNDDSVRLSNSTIMTVLVLAGHAYMTGDYESADYHNRGVLKLVGMRGVDTFLQDTKMLIEIIRCDLVLSIDNLSTPILFTPTTIPWPLILPSTTSQNPPFLPHLLSPLLHPVYTSLLNFTNLIHLSSISEEHFLHNMTAILYRLLFPRFPMGSVDEAFRLAMLAFGSPVFLHWNRVELPSPIFTQSLRGAVEGFFVTDSYRKGEGEQDNNERGLAARERVWLCMVTAMAMEHEVEGVAWIRPWLRRDAELCGVRNWEGTRELLMGVLWIGLVYDEPGKHLFDELMGVQGTENYVTG